MELAYYANKTRGYFRWLLLIASLVIIATIANFLVYGQLDEVKEFITECTTEWGWPLLIVGGIIYLLLLSIPFVPGVELGLLLMCIFGQEGIIFIYLSTVGGLNLAFAFGRWISEEQMNFWLKKLEVQKIPSDPSSLVKQILEKSTIGQKLHHRFGHYLLKYRYFTLALLFNLPGNYVIGGGGGIGLVCGLSRVFKWRWFLITTILATAPIPLLAFLGFIQLEALLFPQT